MSASVAAAVHQLRRFRPESTEPLDRVAASAEVLREALQRLRLTSDPQFAVPSADVATDVGAHANRSRVLGEVFDEAARRFARTQDARTVTLPAVFGRYPGSFVGPVPTRPAAGRGRSSLADDRWVEARLAQIAGRPASILAQQIGAQLRRKLGLLDARPYVLDVREHRIRLAGEVPIAPGLTIGGAAEQVWTIVELSDGTALASRSLRHGVDARAGGGSQLEVTAGGRTVGFDQHTEAVLGVGVGQSRTRQFGSRAEAERAMATGRLEGFEDLVLGAIDSVVPGLSTLAGRLTGHGHRDDAPRTARTVQVAASAGSHLTVTAGPSLGPSLSAGGTVTLTEERDREAATTTDVLRVDGRVSAALVGALGFAAPASTASVAVTRDAAGGVARALTVNVVFEAEAGLRPGLGAALSGSAADATGPSGPSGPSPAASDSGRYDVTVEVDLTDPRNGPLAAGLSSGGTPAERIDEDLRAVARVPDLGADVLARSRITVLEQVPEDPQGVSVEGLPIEGAVVTTGWRTVQAWETVDGRLQAV